jgi:hypothetical protein
MRKKDHIQLFSAGIKDCVLLFSTGSRYHRFERIRHLFSGGLPAKIGVSGGSIRALDAKTGNLPSNFS